MDLDETIGEIEVGEDTAMETETSNISGTERGVVEDGAEGSGETGAEDVSNLSGIPEFCMNPGEDTPVSDSSIVR